ncbi:MAG: SDR family oxidoreductase [Bacteroidota bacterium]
MDSYNLNGKKILITGASSGIGKEVAIVAAEFGAEIIMTGRDTDHLKQTYSLLRPDNHKVIIADLTNDEDINRLVEQTGKIDGLVHSAGLALYMPIQFISEKNIDQLLKINYLAPVILTAKILRKKNINTGGSIVFISSISTRYPFFGGALYTSSKSAIEGFSKTLAVEVAPKRIRSNCISPTFVETSMLDGAKHAIDKEGINQYEKFLPFGFGKPIDVAKSVVYLLSEHSNWITGENIKLGSF